MYQNSQKASVHNQYNLGPTRDLFQMYGWDNSQYAVLVIIPPDQQNNQLDQ